MDDRPIYSAGPNYLGNQAGFMSGRDSTRTRWGARMANRGDLKTRDLVQTGSHRLAEWEGKARVERTLTECADLTRKSCSCQSQCMLGVKNLEPRKSVEKSGRGTAGANTLAFSPAGRSQLRQEQRQGEGRRQEALSTVD